MRRLLETRKIVPGDAIQYLHHGRRVEGEVQKDGSIKGAGRKGDYYIDPVAFAREDNKWASTDNQSEIRLLFADCSKLGDDDKEQSLATSMAFDLLLLKLSHAQSSPNLRCHPSHCLPRQMRGSQRAREEEASMILNF